jgi:hypothetical protein
MGFLNGALKIDKTSITNITSSDSTEEEYAIGVNISINTRLIAEENKRLIPDLDLSLGLPLYVKVIYNYGAPISTSATDFILSVEKPPDHFIIQTRKLEYQTFIGANELNPSLYTIKKEDLRSGTVIKYPFLFKTTLNKSENLQIIVLPYLESILGEQGEVERRGFDQASAATFSSREYDTAISQTVIEKGSLAPKESSIEDLRQNYYNNLFNFDLFREKPIKKANISDLMPSYGKKNEIKSMFVFDKLNFLRDNSTFGKILSNPKIKPKIKDEIMSSSCLNSIRIYRQKQKNTRDFKNNSIAASKNEIKELLIETFENDNKIQDATRTFNTSNLPMSRIGEISLGFPEKYYKVIAFNDYDTANDGKYAYFVGLKMEDGILLWLLNSLEKLVDAQNTFKNYYLVKYINLSAKSGSTDFDFFGTAAAAAEAALISQNIAAINTLVDILSTLNSNIDVTPELQYEFLNLLVYEKTTLELMRYVDNFVNKISVFIGSSALTSQINFSLSTGYAKDNAHLFFLEFQTKFNTIVNFDELRNLNYDYINITANDDLGISSMSEIDFVDRCGFEFGKLIKNRPESFRDLSIEIFGDTFFSSPGPSNELGNSYFNFDQTRYSYLAPKIISGVELTKFNIFNNEVLNNIHYQNKHSTLMDPDLSVSYFMQQLGISLQARSFYELESKADPKKEETYTNATSLDGVEVTSYESEPAELIKSEFEGPTDTRDRYRLFINAILKQEEDWNLSKEFFNNIESTIANLFNIKLATSLSVGSQELKKVKNMPNQIRALFAGKSDKCTNKWLATEGDYFDNPDTYYMMKENYMNLVKIEILHSFGNDVNGIPSLKMPLFRRFKTNDINQAGKFLCKLSLYDDQAFKVGIGFEERNYPDRYFLLNLAGGAEISGLDLGISDPTGDITPEEEFSIRDVPQFIIDGFTNRRGGN